MKFTSDLIMPKDGKEMPLVSYHPAKECTKHDYMSCCSDDQNFKLQLFMYYTLCIDFVIHSHYICCNPFDGSKKLKFVIVQLKL